MLRRISAAGTTLTETIVAATITVSMLGVAIPAFESAADAGDQGQAHVLVDSETRHALYRIAREMENTSTTAVDSAGVPRLTIVDGLDPEPLVYEIVNGQSQMGGFEGTLGAEANTENSTTDPNSKNAVAGTAQTCGPNNADEAVSKGSGERGLTHAGRQRDGSIVGTVGIGDNSARPRHAVIAKNSVVSFQKVAGYTVDAAGAPIVTWTNPITYRVVNRQLIRIQDGLQSVVCPVCTGFKAQITDIGSVVLTIVSQAKMHARPGLAAEANQIEVSPKN